MKKGFLVLLFFVLAISGWHGYERWQKEQQTAEHLTGSLSDIARHLGCYCSAVRYRAIKLGLIN